MARALLILANQAVRDRAVAWIRTAPDFTRIVFQEAKRSTEQSDRMWAMLTDVSRQATLGGAKYIPEDWKCIFMAQLGHESRFLPRLEGAGFTPVGFRSSKLSKREMSDLMDLIEAWGNQHGVVFATPAPQDERQTA